MMNDRDLNDLLATPLTDVADNGFSAHVVDHLEKDAVWSERLTWGIPLLAACAAVPFVPVHELNTAMVHLTPGMASYGALSLAAGAMILTLALEQRFREWQSAL